MINLPPKFVQTVREVHGEAGAAWLDGLPGLLETCAARWGLTLGPPFGLSFNYVAPAVRADGTAVVLKVGPPHKELWTELAALRVFDGRGSARLLDADQGLGALLLERLEPGTTLVSLPDDAEATEIAAGVMRDLWRPAPPGHTFPTVADWAGGLVRLRARFGGGTGPLPDQLVEQAEALFAELLATERDPVLLHGDLHHDNILRGRGTWLAIDPKGIVGEPAFEASAFLLNPSPQPADVLARRLDIFAAAWGADRARVRGWGLARAVLSACWTIEDGGQDWDGAITVAERLAQVSR